MKPLEASIRPARYSIAWKYGFGYLLILLLALIIFGVSLAGGTMITQRYDSALEDLLRLNELFADVEETNRYLYDCVIYLRPTSLENCEKSRAAAQSTVDGVLALLDSEYSRDVMDLCGTVQTYLDQNEELVETLLAYRTGESFENNLAVQEMYGRSQSTIGYINQSFKDIYSAKLVSTKVFQEKVQTLRMLVNAVQVVLVLLAVALFLVFYRSVVEGLTRSIKTLTLFASKLAREPMCTEHVSVKTGDELEVFACGFNNMVDTIQTQFLQIKEDQRARDQLQKAEMENIRMSSALQNSQLRLLESRINPHFLFNTLNMITQTAYMEDAEETAHLMEATAEYLRYNLGKVTKAVTLGDEIGNAKDYVYIQQCRFGKRVSFRFETDEVCLGQEVPCMILQPLMENSIKYGVGLMISGGEIITRIFQDNARCCIEVEDNGVGIPEKELAALQESIVAQTDPGEHIGLRNVYQRIRLYFNEDIEFSITSGAGRTCIHIGLPWRA